MAVIILGSGITPVVGTREFYPIPGGSGGSGDVSFGSGDANNYVITSTGVGNVIQGEANLQFNGSTLILDGNFNIPNGNINVTNMTSAATTSVMHYNTSTGAVTYAASGGGTSTFLRADGTWASPLDDGITITGTPADGQITVWTSDSSVEGTNDFIFNAGDLYINTSIIVDGDVNFPVLSNAVTTAVLNYNMTNGAVTYNSSGGGTTNFLRADGAWAVPIANVTKVGTTYNNQVAVWTGDGTIEGTNDLMFDANVLTVSNQITTQRIDELNTGLGVRLPYKTQLGADTTPTATLDVTTSNGSNPSINVDNQGAGYALVLTATSATTAQQTVISDAYYSNITRGLDILHITNSAPTSGPPAVGFGTGLTLSTEYDSGVNQISAAIDTVITDPVYASGDANLSIKLNSTNVLEERFVFDSSGIFQTDVINELTVSTGVTIEGVLIEDSNITIPTANYLCLNAAGNTNIFDDAGVMTFTDIVTGPITLATLAVGDVAWGTLGVGTHNLIQGDSTSVEELSNVTWNTSTGRLDVTGTLQAARYEIASSAVYINVNGGVMEFIDTTSGTVSLTSLVAGDGNVSWGTASNNYLVFGSASTDIQSDSSLTWTSGNHALNVGGDVSDGGELRLSYNATDTWCAYASSAIASIQTFHTSFLLRSFTDGAYIGIGATSDSNTWVTLSDPSTTVKPSILRVRSADLSAEWDFRDDGTYYITGLGSDDTEDHVMAIDDITGLVTKRSVASIVSAGQAISFGLDHEVPYTNVTTDDFDYSNLFRFDGSVFRTGNNFQLLSSIGGHAFQMTNTSGIITTSHSVATTSTGQSVSWAGGESSSTTGTHHGGPITITGGNQTGTLGGDGGDVFLYGGSSISGTRGQVYVGDGSAAASLQARSSETNVVYYDTTTGLLTYDSPDAIGSFGNNDEIPHTNAGGTDFDYDSNFTWSGTNLRLGSSSSLYASISITLPGLTLYGNAGTLNSWRTFSSTSSAITNQLFYMRSGGTVASRSATPTNSLIARNEYQIWDGTSWETGLRYDVEVDGTVATNDFDTKATWSIKEGASAITDLLELNPNGLEYFADHSTDQAANDRWIPDKAYVDADRNNVIRAQVLWSNTAQTTIVTLPTGAVIWDIYVETTTTFNGTGTALLDIGVTATGNRYEDDLDIASTGFKTMSLTNIPDRMTASTNITFQYFDSNSDVSAGAAYIYVHYSKH